MRLKQQVIAKLSPGRFRLRTTDTLNSSLILDFNPLINFYGFKPPVCYVHWQARPKYQRRWGVYDQEQDMYFSGNNVVFRDDIKTETLQLDESLIRTVPTAVLAAKGRVVAVENYEIYLGL